MSFLEKVVNKNRIIFLTMVMCLAVTTQSALASFADTHLIRVYYDRADGREVLSDLGAITGILAAQGQQTFAGTFGPISSNLPGTFAVYFAVDRTTDQLWASGSTVTPAVIVGGATAMTKIKNYFGSPLNPMYKSALSAQQGSLGGAIDPATRPYTELSLANLASNSTQALYFWNNGSTIVGSEKTGHALATITTYLDGSTTITALPTPIPAVAWLLGSGLLGLAGMRRRDNKPASAV